MVNETIQWAVILAMALMILGLYREISVTSPTRQVGLSDGLHEGDHLPQEVVAKLADASARFKAIGATISFVVENCSACQRLLGELPGAIRENPGSLAVVAREPSGDFRKALRELGVPIVFDEDGDIWRACRITATPLVVYVDNVGVVRRQEVTHDVRRFAESTS